MLPAAQQVPEIERVAAMVCSSDRSVLFLAEVPFGPICPNEVLTFAIASPLHWSPVATVIPPAVATNAKDNLKQLALLSGECKWSRQPCTGWITDCQNF